MERVKTLPTTCKYFNKNCITHLQQITIRNVQFEIGQSEIHPVWVTIHSMAYQSNGVRFPTIHHRINRSSPEINVVFLELDLLENFHTSQSDTRATLKTKSPWIPKESWLMAITSLLSKSSLNLGSIVRKSTDIISGAAIIAQTAIWACDWA